MKAWNIAVLFTAELILKGGVWMATSAALLRMARY